jgi:prepilin-type N-terminal cleavage/methylation domain-containing protein
MTEAKKGFTLIELLVSVAILGRLATISISMFNEYRKKVNNAEMFSLVHTLKNIAEIMAADMIDKAADHADGILTTCELKYGRGDSPLVCNESPPVLNEHIADFLPQNLSDDAERLYFLLFLHTFSNGEYEGYYRAVACLGDEAREGDFQALTGTD